MIKRFIFGALLTGVFAGPAQAEEPERFDLHAAILEEAFDPERFFGGWRKPSLTIRYTGDDYDFPVYAIALFLGCHADDPKGNQSCGKRLQARMVRAPYDGEPERPRWRGVELLKSLTKAGVTDRAQLRNAMDKGAVEWLEIDLSICPTALEKARAIDEVSFFVKPLVPQPGLDIELVLHADTVRVVSKPNYYTTVTFESAPRLNTPGGWAVEFASTLENCWIASTATRPWRRAAEGRE